MEQRIERQFQNLSLPSSSMEETMENQFQRTLSLPAIEEPNKKQKIQNIRILFSSRVLMFLDEVVAALVRDAKEMHLMVWGPHMLPTQVLNVRYRLAPSPKGLNLVRDIEYLIHKRAVDVLGSTKLVEQVISGVVNHHVTIEVQVVD